MFTIQFYTSSGNPPFPADGFTLLDGTLLFTFIYTHIYEWLIVFVLGMVSSILKNEPANWDVGYVLEQAHEINRNSYHFHLSAYTNYIDNLLVNCKFFGFIF